MSFRFDWTPNIIGVHVDVSSPYLLVTPGHSHTAALLDTNCCSSNLTGRQLARSLSGMQCVYALGLGGHAAAASGQLPLLHVHLCQWGFGVVALMHL